MSGIVIVDYGMANLRSVQKAFEQVGHAAEITATRTASREAAKVVLPGVGAFRDAIVRLRETHLGDRDHRSHQRGPTVPRDLSRLADALHPRLRGRRPRGARSVPGRRGAVPRGAGAEGAAHGLEHAQAHAAELPALRRTTGRPRGLLRPLVLPGAGGHGCDRGDRGLSRSRSRPRSGATTSSRLSFTRRRVSELDCRC